MMEADVTDVLPAVRVPTLIVFKESEREQSEYVAERIADVELAEIKGFTGMFTWVDDEVHEQTMRETGRFIESVGRPPAADRVLATVLFTDIVDSTKRAAELGDAAWRALLERHHARVRRCLARHRGTEIDIAGDGFLATFDGPRRAIECAQAVVRDLKDLGLVVRTGVHTGECEVVESKVAGIAVNIGARIAAEAGAGEVLVSSTVKDLVAGSPLSFEDRGEHELKGLGAWRLYSVSDA
jgi:class 3 adenylate cyclase